MNGTPPPIDRSTSMTNTLVMLYAGQATPSWSSSVDLDDVAMLEDEGLVESFDRNGEQWWRCTHKGLIKARSMGRVQGIG